MSRLLRHLFIWLSCTAASVTAVILTIHFVVGSTRPTAPVAQSAPRELPAPPAPTASETERPSPGVTPTATRKPGPPAPSRTTASAKPTEPDPVPTPTPSASSTPPPQPSAGSGGGGGDAGCQGGAGVYTVPSEGGKATVRFGASAVCLISAVPDQGFTASTAQDGPRTLTVTFSGPRHRSEITATTEPRSGASVREVSF